MNKKSNIYGSFLSGKMPFECIRCGDSNCKFKKRLLCASYAFHAACPNHSSRKAHNRKGWIIDVSMVVCGAQNLFVDDL